MDDCVFCRIVAGEIDSDEVLSTGSVVAFRDVNPVAPVHVLIVPRRHIASVADLGTEVGSDDGPILSEMMSAARTVARCEDVAQSGYRLVFNVGEDAANTIGHLHLHVLGGRRMGWPPG